MAKIITGLLEIQGMTCVMCSKAVETAVMKTGKAKSVQVDLANEVARIEYILEDQSLEEFVKSIEKSGYEVKIAENSFKISGMTCVMCEKAVTKALIGLLGVISAQVNLASETVLIKYLPKMVNYLDFKIAVEKAGYEISKIEKQAEPDNKADRINSNRLKRTILGLTVSIPMMILMYIPHLHVNLSLIYFIVSTPVFIYLSAPIFTSAFMALRNKNLNMEVAYSLGIGAAYISSVMATFGVLLSEEFMFYETSIMLASFLMLGKYLENRAKSKTSLALKKLAQLAPENATVLKNGIEYIIHSEDVNLGDICIVKPGEKFPADGIVIEGISYVDESSFSGESLPVEKTPESKVIGGSVNIDGLLKIKAEKVGAETSLAQIIKMVENAQSVKPKIQKVADKIVTYFIPVIMIVSILTFVIWYFIIGAGLVFSFSALISVLVVACPCALGLATPTAVTVGLGRGAELGIFIKNGEALENFDKINTIMLDKTGTITEGKPIINDILSLNIAESGLVKIAASIESGSLHPLAKAIINKAKELNITNYEVANIKNNAGLGIVGDIEGKTYYVGSIKYMNELKLDAKPIEEFINKSGSVGATNVIVADTQRIIGAFALSDKIKEDSQKAIKRMKEMGFSVIMATGDNIHSAHSIAKQVGIDEVRSGLTPLEKARYVEEKQSKGSFVAFIGDGVNDAPALVSALIGIAPGSGADIAKEAGDVALVGDSLNKVVTAIELGRKTIRRIKINIFWAFFYNTALIPIAAGALYIPWGIAFKPEYAGFAMAMSSVTVISFSLALKAFKPKQ